MRGGYGIDRGLKDGGPQGNFCSFWDIYVGELARKRG